MSAYDTAAEAEALRVLVAATPTASLREFLSLLSSCGVREYSARGVRIVLEPRPSVIVAPAAQPSTPEQSGTTAPTRDIFEILSDGMIPGAPRPDGYPPDPT